MAHVTTRENATLDPLGDERSQGAQTASVVTELRERLAGEEAEIAGVYLVGPDGRPQEGFLRLHEIYNLDLKADLVVLSACQTGVGREIRVERDPGCPACGDGR